MIEAMARAIRDSLDLSPDLEYDLDDAARYVKAAQAAYAVVSAECDGLRKRVIELGGAINEARVHLSDLVEEGLQSVDSADEILRATLSRGE
jgi:hypothetical protein